MGQECILAEQYRLEGWHRSRYRDELNAPKRGRDTPVLLPNAFPADISILGLWKKVSGC